MESLDLVSLILLFITGCFAFTFSTLSGGGGALLSVPVVSGLLGPEFTAPVVNLGTFIGRPTRLILFWKKINWKVVVYYAPSALIGSCLAAWWFNSMQIEWLRLLLGVFLISTIFQFKYGKKKRSFNMRLIHFIPLGLVVSALVTLIGALGPVLNPFYLNHGLEKEDLIATKTANAFLLGLFQVGSYTFFGLLKGEYWFYGLALGLGASIGNIIGKKFLQRVQAQTFRVFLLVFMGVSGAIMVVKALFF
jgi:uncharacterized membrane protein YfcA